MEIGENSGAAELLDNLELKKENLQAKAVLSPETAEEYMALSEDSRMTTAMQLMRQHADITYKGGSFRKPPEESECVKAKLPTDDPSIVIKARVGFHDMKTTSALNSVHVDRDRALIVWASAADIDSNIESDFKELGMVLGGWPDDIPEAGFKVSVGFREQIVSKDDETAQQIVEIIDKATSELIEGIVRVHRQIGVAATTANAKT